MYEMWKLWCSQNCKLQKVKGRARMLGLQEQRSPIYRARQQNMLRQTRTAKNTKEVGALQEVVHSKLQRLRDHHAAGSQLH